MMDEKSLPNNEDMGSASDDESRSGSDPVSSEESDVEKDELSGGAAGLLLALYRFELSDSNCASAVPECRI